MSQDPEIMSNYIDFIYRFSKLDPSEHPALFTEPVNNDTLKREKLMEIMFEKFNVPGFFLENVLCYMLFLFIRRLFYQLLLMDCLLFLFSFIFLEILVLF